MKLRITSAFLLFALLMTVCTSCASGDQTDESVAEVSTEETGPVFTPAPIDLGSKTVRVLAWENGDIHTEKVLDSVIPTAIYQRNETVENLYNFKFEFDVRFRAPLDYDNWKTLLDASVYSGDHSYQLAAGYTYRLAYNSLEGNCHNLLDSEYIDFENEWWPTGLIDVANIGNRLCIAMGHFDSSFYEKTYAFMFNKALVKDLKIEDPYTVVKDGRWTLEKMFEVAKQGTADLNGDGIIDDNDRYGYITNENMGIDAYLNACEIRFTNVTSNGNVSVLPLSERLIDLQTKLNDFVNRSGIVGKNMGGGTFGKDRAMLFSGCFEDVISLRSMETDFGIIPYPKYDENQKDYHGYCANGNCTSLVIPITEDVNEMGAVIEAMAYYGYTGIMPQYMEVALKSQGARDFESAEMIDIIMEDMMFSFVGVYSFGFGDQKAPGMCLRQSIKEDRGISSYWSGNYAVYKAKLKKILDLVHKEG